MVLDTILHPYTIISLLFLLVSFNTLTSWQTILHTKPIPTPQTVIHTKPVPPKAEAEKAVAGDRMEQVTQVQENNEASEVKPATNQDSPPEVTPTPTQVQVVNAIIVTQPPTPTTIPNTPTPTVTPTTTQAPEEGNDETEDTSEVLPGELLDLLPVPNTVNSILDVEQNLLRPR